MPPNKPCPFCGGRRLRVIEQLNYDATPSGIYAVVCDDCGAHGPGSKNEAGAREKWEERKNA